jgi:hypothetical protein
MKGNSFSLLNAALIEAKRSLNLEPAHCRRIAVPLRQQKAHHCCNKRGLKADEGRECQTARYRRDGSDTLIGVKIVGSNR